MQNDEQLDRTRRPLMLRVLPGRLRLSLWSRLYRGSHGAWRPLYVSAPLHFAPRLTMQLVPGDVISDAIAFTGIYELSLSKRVRGLARLGGTMIEVGANLGYFSLLWASARAGNRCVSFEASPRNLPLLRENIARNGLASQVRVVSMAAGACRAVLAFDTGPQDQTGWGGLTRAGTPDAVNVDVVRVDEIVDPNEPIALLKVDAEGADTWVLEGCERLLRGASVREIWYEQNKPRMEALGIPQDAAETFLRNMGYTPAPEGDRTLPVVEWRATRGN